MRARTHFSTSLLVLYFCFQLSIITGAQVPELVQDIYTGPFDQPFNAQSIAEFKGDLLLLANDGVTGRELWKYDGDTATLVQDIRTGFEGANPEFFTVLGDQMVFRAFDDVHGSELWTFDGTTARIIQDLNPGIAGSIPLELFLYNDEILFCANDGITGNELWKYDGTSISLVENIRENDQNSDPSNFIYFQDKVYFQATDGIGGFELWQYDGNDVTLAQEINRGQSSSFPEQFTVAGDYLYFTANDGVHGKELWKFDGNTAVLAHDINPSGGSFPNHLIALGNEIIFVADDGTHGSELWKYDGNTASLVKDINIGPAGASLDTLVKLSSAVYFGAEDSNIGNELWRYDGTRLDLVSDINGGPGDSSPADFVAFGTNLYFSAFKNNIGRELFKFDGRVTRSFNINPDSSSGPAYGHVVGCDLFFGAIGSAELGIELWRLPDAGNSTAMINETSCEETYTSPDGQVYAEDGSYQAIVSNSIGCDSLININLSFLSSSSSSIAETACTSYQAPDGVVYTEDGIYTAIISNAVGCDSTITIDLTVNNINTEVTVDGITLTALAEDVSYQWLDCNNNFERIEGATSQSFTPLQSGSYVALLTDTNGCTDTTTCINGVVASLGSNDFKRDFNVFPTVTQGSVTIALGEVYQKVEIALISLSGQSVELSSFESTDEIEVELPMTPGFYILGVRTSNGISSTFKLLKL